MRERNKALVVNLFGGPGTGKSSEMAGVFSELKFRGIDCEQVPEYAKDVVWQESYRVFDSQMYVFGKQYHRLNRVADKVEVAITDAPLLFTLIYNQQYKEADKLVLECFDEFNNLNIFLKRKKKYNPNGRTQTLDEAKELDVKIKDMLDKNNIPYIEIDATKDNIELIADMIMERLGKVEEDNFPEKVELNFGFYKAVIREYCYCNACGEQPPFTPMWSSESSDEYCQDHVEEEELEDKNGEIHNFCDEVSQEDIEAVLMESHKMKLAYHLSEAKKLRKLIVKTN